MRRGYALTTTRRLFLRTLLGIGGLLAGCQTLDGPSTATTTDGSPAPSRAWRWEIRWIRGTPPQPRADGDGAWRLRLDGMVAAPRELTLAELRALPATAQRSRLKCVECWSAPTIWRGVSGADLLSVVERLPAAAYLRVHAADGYDSTIAVVDIADERTLFAYDMDGKPLPADHGYPLRLILPAHYGYKGVKAIARLELTDRMRPGYWESRGYDEEGIIMAGIDRPLDLNGVRQIGPGEITDY